MVHITPADVLAFLDSTDANPVTRKKYLHHLGYLFRYLIGQGVLDRDLSNEVKLPRLPDMAPKILPVLQPYVTSICVFGSMARGEAGPDSDVDLLIELKPAGQRPALGLRWFTLEEELAVLLGRPVELVTEGALSPRVRPYVEQDRVVLYEEG